MTVVLIGEDESRPGNPYFMTGTLPIDQLVLPGPVAQERLEDLQLWSCLQALALHGALAHPVETAIGNDPPDRVLLAHGVSHSIELTELTMQDLRINLAQVRHIGRIVAALINQNGPDFAHLLDRAVHISSFSHIPLSKATTHRIAQDICESLATDKGCFDGGVSAHQLAQHGWPDRIDVTTGNYGEVHGLYVVVIPSARPAGIHVPVVATSQANFYLDEARDMIRQRIEAKDDPRNEILLITTGLPDKAGYRCPLDHMLFSVIYEHGLGATLEPSHLNGVLMHQWGTPEVAEVYRRPEVTLPYRPAPKRGDS